MSARAVGSSPEIATALDGATFVAVRARADGDSLAAAGLVAAACRACSVPFGVRVGRDPERPPAVDGDGLVVTVGWDAPGDGTVGPADMAALTDRERSASVDAYAVAREAGDDPDPVLALAGAIAGGSVPGTDGTEELLADAKAAGLARRPGIAVPTADLGVGLAASTRVRVPASGDVAAAREAVASVGADGDPDTDARRRLASLVATGAAAAANAPPGAATAVEAGLRPYAGGPLATVGGYADVLDALALAAPGLGIGIAIADDPTRLSDAALDAWRDHGLTAHRALDSATRRRYDGALVVVTDAPPAVLPTVARVARQFRSAEPVVIAVGTDAPGNGTAAGSDGGDDETVPVAVSAADSIGVSGALGDALSSESVWGGPARGGGRAAAARGGTGPADAAVESLVAAIRRAE